MASEVCPQGLSEPKFRSLGGTEDQPMITIFQRK